MSDFDIVVAGGGMVGATLASLVSRAVPALRIAVVEGRQPEPMPAPDAGWSNRVSAVSGASNRAMNASKSWGEARTATSFPWMEYSILVQV